MILFYLIGFLLLCAAIVFLLGLTPERITDDLMKFISPFKKRFNLFCGTPYWISRRRRLSDIRLGLQK